MFGQYPSLSLIGHAGFQEGRYRELNGDTLELIERKHITNILALTKWKIDGPKGAAVILGLNPSTLRTRIQKLGIPKPKWEANGANN